MTWLYYSLGAALCFACLSILSRIVSVDSKNPRALSLAFNLTSILMAVILFLLTGSYKKIIFPTQTEAWIYFLIAAFFFGMFERLRFFATKLLPASIYSIISNLSVVIAFILSLFIYKEILTLSKAAGFLLILISLFLVMENKKSKVSIKGVLVGLTTSLFLGIAMALDKKGATYFSPEVYNILMWTVPFIVLLFPYAKIGDIKLQFKRFSWKIMLLSLFNFIGYYLGLKAFFLADATKVIPITQSSTIITVIAGIFLLNERNNLTKKIIAGIIAVIGVFLLR
ncbi:MAG: DMT family transporter [Patescibacteria group bacterium]|jgi:drug/metabolite transporter (DMT)-like permease